MDRTSGMPIAETTGERWRIFAGAFLFILLICLMCGAASVPFVYESFTIKYKFGLERALLRTGQVMGVVAGCLLLLQYVLSGRLNLLDRIFSINRMFRCHRISGMLIAALVLLHFVLILIAEGNEILDPALENWPQYAGLFLLATILAIVVAARWRQAIGLAFHRWFMFHKIFTHLAVCIFGVHVLFAADSFASGPPRNGLLALLLLYLLFFLWAKVIRRFSGRSFKVLEITPAARDAFGLKLSAEDGRPFVYKPGQFVFIRFKSGGLSGEEHPFTISSPPDGSPEIRLTIRGSGDWTGGIHLLEPGDKAVVDGPYGLFGNVSLENASEIVMIAGGIGITPMLSILGDLAEKRDARPITLIWSNRTRDHVVHPDAPATLLNRLTGLRVVQLMTREPAYEGEKARLDRPGLERLLAGCCRDAKVVICGPPSMMRSVKRSLVAIGFRRWLIIMERFDL